MSVSIGVAGCGDDDDDGNGGVAGKGGNTSTAGKGGSSGSSNTAGKGGSNSTAGKGGKGGTDGGGGEGGGSEPATAGNGPIGGETSGGTGGAPAGGADTGGQTGEGGGGGETQAATDVIVNGATVLTDAAGKALYVRDGDTVSTDTPDSKCAAGCAGWPVFKVDVASVPAELDAGDFKSFNGSLGDQTAYKGHPLYYFAGDVQPNQVNGDGAGGIWHVVKIPFTP